MSESGQMAYEAYMVVIDLSTNRPPWRDVDPIVKKAWAAAEKRVRLDCQFGSEPSLGPDIDADRSACEERAAYDACIVGLVSRGHGVPFSDQEARAMVERRREFLKK